MTRQSLLRNHDFRHLWIADALSAIGSRLSMLAIPLLALLTLEATAFEVSLLRTLETLATLIFSLIAGAWMDRTRCRPILITADLARAILIGSIPIAAIAGALTLGHLYVAVFLAGIATMSFSIGSTTYLPRLLPPNDLTEANAKLATNQSIGAVLAGGAGGFVIQWLTAPFAIAIDAITYLWSAIWLRRIRATESVPHRTTKTSIRTDVTEGLRFVLGHPILRPLAAYSACTIFFQSMEMAIGIVFLSRTIGLEPAAIGLVSMTGLLGAIIGGLATARVTARLGTARTMTITAIVYAIGFLLHPLTSDGWGLTYWVAGAFAASLAVVAMHINQVTTRQRLCPPHLYGRVGATMEFMIWGIMPIGSITGGIIATLADLRTTLWITAIGITFSILWIIASPIRTLRFPENQPAAG